MRNITIKNIVLAIFVLIALASCTEKGKSPDAEKTKSDSTTIAKTDSTEAAEAKETKEVLDVIKK